MVKEAVACNCWKLRLVVLARSVVYPSKGVRIPGYVGWHAASHAFKQGEGGWCVTLQGQNKTRKHRT